MAFSILAFLCLYLANALALSNLILQGPPTLPSTASYPLNPALGSFSIETAFFEEFVGNSSAPNQLSKNLFENLAKRTGTPAEIRIGGITADSTYWNASQTISLLNFVDNTGALRNTSIGPGFWNSVQLLPKGTKITMTLDLRDLDYHGALSVAESAMKGLQRGQLDTFEIGNEPDQYSSKFTPQNYSQIWGTWAKNIFDALDFHSPEFRVGATVIDPLWPYNATGAAQQLDCVSVLAAGADRDGVVKSCSEHTYQYSVCDPPRIAVATLPNLVNHTRLAQYLDLWQPRIKSVRQQLGPGSFVIGEYNSVSCSGKDGVSNTFGQALWLLDTMMYAASLNVSRMYVHQGGPLALQSNVQLNHGGFSFYNLWYPVNNQNGPIQVFPAYSAHVFVADTLGHSKSLRIANIYPGRQANGSTITTTLGDQSAGQLVAYGFWDDKLPSRHHFPAKFVLLNLQIYNQTQTVPRPTATFDISEFLQNPSHAVTVRRLTAPGADVKFSNVTTWAGQNFASGLPAGKFVEEKITGGKIIVKASEAVLVTV